jgi:hypothetical protein
LNLTYNIVLTDYCSCTQSCKASRI